MAGIDNVFDFIRKHCESSLKGFEEPGAMRPFAKPVTGVISFKEEDLNDIFDREEEEETYVKEVNDEGTENIHKDMMVPCLKNDFIAGHHRDTFLRTQGGSRIRRFIAEAARRNNQAKTVHEERGKMFTSYEALQQTEDG